MAVPKKRKKLDEEAAVSGVSAEKSTETIGSDSPVTEQKPARKGNSKPGKLKSEKLEKAFEVVNQIEKKEETKALEVQKFQPQANQGVHIQFKLDLIRIEDFLEPGKKDEERKDNSIVVDFTIPYFWNLPIINEITNTFVNELKRLKIIQ